MTDIYKPGEAWEKAKEALKNGDLPEAERLLQFMVPSDQGLMRERLAKLTESK